MEYIGRTISLSIDEKTTFAKYKLLELRIELLCDFRALGNEMDGTNSFTIKTEVLGKALSDDHLKSQLMEQSDWVSIFLKISGCEPLVGRVKEWEKTFLLDDFSDFSPLLLGWVNTAWVVSASVEKDNRSFRSIAESLNHALEVQSVCLSIEVRVFGMLEASFFHDREVVGPRRVRDVNETWSVNTEELEANSQSTGSRESLRCDDLNSNNQTN